MLQGKNFLNKCLTTSVETNPWPHQIIDDTFDKNVFDKLREQCEQKYSKPLDKPLFVYANAFKENGIDFYQDTLDICDNLYQNLKEIHGVYPTYRSYPEYSINVHISITPPLPYKFHIHQEGLEKTWSSVTYITPEKNVGTKMYTKEDEKSFVKEAQWKPNRTFIFCGEQRKTWHSYESDQATNRITFNMFIMKQKSKHFYPL